MASASLAQPERTAPRRTPLRGYLPLSARVWGWPPMALLTATYRRTSSTHLQKHLRDNAEGSAIRATVSRIEFDTNKKAQAKWRELYPETEPAGTFLAKVDVSEIPMDELQASLPAFERLLLAHGYSLYCIDYTQDFSGVFDWEALVDHLCASEGFRNKRRPGLRHARRRAQDIGEHRQFWGPCLHIGVHKQSWVHGPNEVVQQGGLNFEAGEVRKPIGCHLANYADCPNVHLRRTFLHPDVQARGCTRIEVAVRLPRGGPLGGHGHRGGGGSFGPGLPLGSAGGTRPVCGPAARQAVEEHGPVPRLVSCPGQPAAGVDIRHLVRAHDNRPGLGCLGPAHQGKRRQRGDLGEGRRVGRGRLWVPRMPHLLGRHSGSQRGGRRGGTAPMLYQGRRCRHSLGG